MLHVLYYAIPAHRGRAGQRRGIESVARKVVARPGVGVRRRVNPALQKRRVGGMLRTGEQLGVLDRSGGFEDLELDAIAGENGG